MEPRVEPLIALCDLSHPTTKTAGLREDFDQGPAHSFHGTLTVALTSFLVSDCCIHAMGLSWAGLLFSNSISLVHTWPPGYMAVTVTFQSLHSPWDLHCLNQPPLPHTHPPTQHPSSSRDAQAGGTGAPPASQRACQILSRFDPDVTSH